jgi:hypothetical protein
MDIQEFDEKLTSLERAFVDDVLRESAVHGLSAPWLRSAVSSLIDDYDELLGQYADAGA